MQPPSANICKICYFPFDSEERKPVVGLCGHSYCSNCSEHFQKIQNANCPTCRKTGAFKNAPTNYALLEHILEESATNVTDILAETKDTDPSAPPLEEEETDKLLTPACNTPRAAPRMPTTPARGSFVVFVPDDSDVQPGHPTRELHSFCARHLLLIICLATVAVFTILFLFGYLEWWLKAPA